MKLYSFLVKISICLKVRVEKEAILYRLRAAQEYLKSQILIIYFLGFWNFFGTFCNFFPLVCFQFNLIAKTVVHVMLSSFYSHYFQLRLLTIYFLNQILLAYHSVTKMLKILSPIMCLFTCVQSCIFVFTFYMFYSIKMR